MEIYKIKIKSEQVELQLLFRLLAFFCYIELQTNIPNLNDNDN